MTKIKTIALVALFAIAAGCSSKGSSGGANPNASTTGSGGGNGGPADGAATVTIDHPIVGAWGYYTGPIAYSSVVYNMAPYDVVSEYSKSGLVELHV